MKNIFIPIITKCYLLCTVFFLCLCLSACQSATKNASPLHVAKLPRADSRYIGWLEKESIANACAKNIKIVAGTPFAWNFSASAHDKENILAASPVWLHINPRNLSVPNKQSPLKLTGNNSTLIKNAGINGLYFYPNKALSFEHLYGMPDAAAEHSEEKQKNSMADSPVSLSMAKETGTQAELFAILQNNIHTAGNILPASLGTGSDFLLALHGVREYPGLFMMTEIPQNAWHLLPPSQTKEYFSPSLPSQKQLENLARNGFVPPAMYRDFFADFPQSGYAVSNEITGYDGITRRWLYRFARTPRTAVLNFYDPAFQTQRLISASIIEEIGIMKQGLVSVSVQDIWGQESADRQNLSENTQLSPKEHNQPARFVLESINRAVHGYGAWTFCRDSFAPELIRTIQESQTDFAADTLLMPALEQAVLAEDSGPLIKAFSRLKEENIDERSLWHGTHRTFNKSPFAFSSLTEFILQKTDISAKEISQLKKMQESPLFMQNNGELAKKLSLAQDLHKLFIGFQSLLPGLNMVSMEDLLGVTDSERPYAAFSDNTYTGTAGQNPLLFGSLAEQAKRKNSAAENLRPLWEFRQSQKLYLAKIRSVNSAGSKKIFSFSLIAPDSRRFDICINLSPQPQTIYRNGQAKTLRPFEISY